MTDSNNNNNPSDSEYTQKQVAYYSAAVQAWLDTRMERDRMLLTLAAGGIGILVSLLTTIGPKSVTQAILYGLATLSFLVTVVAVILVLGRNGTLMTRIVKGESDSDPCLRLLDLTAAWSFTLGIVFTVTLGTYAMVEKLTTLH